MNHRLPPVITLAALAILAAVSVPVRTVDADEGMWLLNHPPREILIEKYGFDPSDEWLEHMQKSAVRFSNGGSGSIVSAAGLVMTNHHIAADVLYNLSTPDRDLLKEGFYAPTPADEIPVPDLKLDLLWQIEDVTQRVKAAAQGKEPARAEAARRAEMAAIESESQEQTGLHSEVVTLYHGGAYHLYRYKRYTDVRLVFAPEEQAGFFGGDNDNFEFPRYCLDVSLFRIYKDGKPLKPEHYLQWSTEGASEGDLTFVFGHPGRTQRLYTVDHLRFLRDVHLPQRLRWAWRLQAKLEAFSGRSPENERIARDLLFGVSNARKAWTGQLESLMNPRTIAIKSRAQGRMTGQYTRINPAGWADVENAFADIRDSLETYRKIYTRQQVFKVRGKLFEHALTLLRLGDELPKPSGERLREYRDSNLDAVRQTLFADTPIYPDFEAELVASALSRMAEVLGRDDIIVRSVLRNQSPRERAEEAVRASALFDAKMRRRYAALDREGLLEHRDSMIELARALDPEMRRLRAVYEDEVESVQHDAYNTIAAAWFAVDGENVYPDATFTLRMGFGTIAGYTEPNGNEVPAFTTIGGMYRRSALWNSEKPFDLPRHWAEHENDVDKDTPLDFVYNADTIGGNSGSPVVDREGKVVGLNFDSNLYKLGNNVRYIKNRGRAIAVDARAIIEALRNIYGADRVVSELLSE